MTKNFLFYYLTFGLHQVILSSVLTSFWVYTLIVLHINLKLTMFGIRTPVKPSENMEKDLLQPKMTGLENTTESAAIDAAFDSPGSSGLKVRKSINKWESGKPESQTCITSPQNRKGELPNSKSTGGAQPSTEKTSSPLKPIIGKATDKVAEARALLVKGKLSLSQSRNLRSDIKGALLETIEGLFKIVKEIDSRKGKSSQLRNDDMERVMEEEKAKDYGKDNREWKETMQKHMELIKDNSKIMSTLQEAIDKIPSLGMQMEPQVEGYETLLSEVRELRQTTEETGRRVSSLPSYAEVVARPTNSETSTKLCSKHSIIISSDLENDTSDEVLGKVREALDAKTNGLQVTRVRKVRNQKVVLSCNSREEMTKLSQKLTAKNLNLKVEEAKNKDPLIILKNLLSYNKDEDIVSSLKTQNAGLLQDLANEDFRAVVKYRRKARNPHENHVVLQVSPKLWQKLTLAGRVHIDLQYVTVQDQSPLIQCTRCLGYGHGRRLCNELTDLCSYCAGPHLRANCPSYLTGETPACRNCRLAKCQETNHNAFDSECPIRKRWDAIARSSVAYC